MFAPKIPKPQTKTAADWSSLVRPRSTLAANRNGPLEQALFLQHTIGNQATLRLLWQPARNITENEYHGRNEQKADLATAATRRVSWDFSKVPLFPSDRAHPAPQLRDALQPKFAVGQVNDPLEHDADRVADEVLHTPANPIVAVTAAPQVTRKCAQCEQEREVQPKRAERALDPLGEAPALVRQVLNSPGLPLDGATRAYFEPRFRHDFSAVRVHTDDAATRSATSIGARAYTYGSDIFFAAGERPRANRLTAHELTHVVQNVSGGDLSVIRRTPAPAESYEIIGMWNVEGRTVVLVKADGRVFSFYRRSGLGDKGRFKGVAPGEGKWVPFEGFTETESLETAGVSRAEWENLSVEARKELTKHYERSFRYHKEPYYYAPDVEEGLVPPGYGNKINYDMAEWLDEKFPPGTIEGLPSADWRVVQKEFDRYKPRHLPEPGKEAAQKALERSGEIGGPERPGSGPSGGGTVEATVEETTERIVAPRPTPAPKAGFFRRAVKGIKTGLVEGLEAALSPEAIAAEIPEAILAVADKVAAREAIRKIETKFAKEGFAKGVAAGVAGWSKEEVKSNLKNRVTQFRVEGLEDPAGLLGDSYILQLAEAYENYAVDLGYQFSSSKSRKWKDDMRAKGLAELAARGVHFGEGQSSAPAVKRVNLGNVIVEEELDPAESGPEPKPRYLSEYDFIDKLAWVLGPTTDAIIEGAIEKGEERREAKLRKIRREMIGF
jgi:Domain of unknown function (DUF4157)